MRCPATAYTPLEQVTQSDIDSGRLKTRLLAIRASPRKRDLQQRIHRHRRSSRPILVAMELVSVKLVLSSKDATVHLSMFNALGSRLNNGGRLG